MQKHYRPPKFSREKKSCEWSCNIKGFCIYFLLMITGNTLPVSRITDIRLQICDFSCEFCNMVWWLKVGEKKHWGEAWPSIGRWQDVSVIDVGRRVKLDWNQHNCASVYKTVVLEWLKQSDWVLEWPGNIQMAQSDWSTPFELEPQAEPSHFLWGLYFIHPNLSVAATGLWP